MRLLMILNIIIFFSTNALAYVNIYPLSFDKRIDGMGAVKDYVLTNTTSKTVRYQVKIDETNFEKDMSRWTEIYPAVITLKPGQKKEVKIYTRAPKNAKDGEYKMVLNIKEIEVPSEKRTERKKINVFTNLKLNLYGYIGNLDSSISLNEVQIKLDKKRITLTGKIKNESLRRVSLEIVAFDKKNKKEVLLAELKLRQNEEYTLENLKLYIKDKEQDYQNFSTILIYEKGIGKKLGEIKINKSL